MGAGVTRNENPRFFIQTRSLLDGDHQFASTGYGVVDLGYLLDLQIMLEFQRNPRSTASGSDLVSSALNWSRMKSE
jgi:hypothetical protein